MAGTNMRETSTGGRVAAAIAAVALLAVAPPSGAQPSGEVALRPMLGAAAADDMTLGDPKAKVLVAEYASAACPHCANFNNQVFQAFRRKYIDTGKVFFVYHEFLTPPLDFAASSFLVARCAGKGKYFDVLDAIYQKQAEIYASGDRRVGLLRIARSAGLTGSQFKACITDDKALDALNARVDKAAKTDGVEATPTFVINGTRIVGEQTLAQLDAAVAAAR